MYINSVSIRKRTLGSISCNTTTSRPLQLIPLNWVPLELLQDSDSSQAIAPHWSSSYPKYLSPEQDKAEQWRIVWARLRSHQSNLASRLSKQKECYLALCQELNPRTTQVESSHEPLFRDILIVKENNRVTGTITITGTIVTLDNGSQNNRCDGTIAITSTMSHNVITWQSHDKKKVK